jgi:hypothetical protein
MSEPKATVARQVNIPAEASGRRAWIGGGMAAVVVIAAVRLLLLLLSANRYGYFGDELYFLDCAKHLDFGYVDQPPLIAVIAWLTRHTIGDSLFAIHLVSALAGAGIVVLTGMIAREMGGRRYAVVLASLGTMFSFVMWTLDHLFTMNAFEPLLWMGCALLVVRLINTGRQKLWLWFGVLAGIGLENKYSMAIFGFAIVAGLLLTRERRAFAHKWIWIAGAIAFLIFLPNLIWNVQHHWPFVELMRNIRASGRDVSVGPFDYLVRQVLLTNPLTLPLWLAGLGWLFFGVAAGNPPAADPRHRGRYRVLGWAYVVSLIVMIVFGGKDYYLAPAYPMLFAAGAIGFERWFSRPALAWVKIAYPALAGVFTAVMLPMFIPVLPLPTYLKYQSKVPFGLPADERAHALAKLPHYYAWDMGWEDMVERVARIYNSLPPEERAKTAIFAHNFGEAGAIDLLGPKYGLPQAISGHQSYWLWGPRDYTGESVIILGSSREDMSHWDSCQTFPRDNPLGAVWEQRPIYYCRQHGRWTIQQIWPQEKSWD